MTEKIQRINNPLTIIAIFAALAEINSTIAIGLIDKELHYIFIWFLIGFPTLLVIFFFLTLNYNTKVMYSPSDYKDDKSFMDSLFGSNFGHKNDNGHNEDLSKLSIELENKMTEKFNQRIESMQSKSVSDGDLKREIETIKAQVKQVTEESIKEIREESILKSDLKEKMLNFYQYPAFFLLIYAIYYSKSSTIEQLRSFSKKFYLPEHWEEMGIDRLLSEGIISGSIESFSINEEYKDQISNWADRNAFRLRQLSRKYSKIEDLETDEEKSKYRELMTRYCESIKF